jgi:hypothetical protein
MNILFENYSVFEYELVDSYIYACNVYRNGTISKVEYICVKIKKMDEPLIICCMDFTEFMGKCLSNERKAADVSEKKKSI